LALSGDHRQRIPHAAVTSSRWTWRHYAPQFGLVNRSPPGTARGVAQLICDGKALRGSIKLTAGGGTACSAKVRRWIAPLGIVISQAGYVTGENDGRAVLKKLLWVLNLQWCRSRQMPGGPRGCDWQIQDQGLISS
jgi:hypothetical protein